MVFLMYNDILPILITAILFSVFATAHRIILPNMYCSYLIFKYEGDSKKTAKSTAIRILYVVFLAIFLYKVFNFTEIQIYAGIFLSCFLNVWTGIVQYHLLHFWNSKEKKHILLGYISFIVFTVFFAYFALNILCPAIFENKEIRVIDNVGYTIIITLFSVVIPISFEGILANYTSICVPYKIDTFREEVEILINQMAFEDEIEQLYRYEIDIICTKNNIPNDLLGKIVTLEYIYRGRTYYKVSEHIVCRCFPSLAIKKDISVGITQIRISTAQKILKMAPQKFIVKLLDFEFNLEVCGRLLGSIVANFESNKEDCNIYYNDIYEYIASKYLCEGKSGLNRTVMLYSAVLRSKVDFPCD